MKKILLILLLSTPLLAQSWLSTDLWKLGSSIITPVGNYNIGLAGGSLYLGYTADPTSGNKFAVNGNSYLNGSLTAKNTLISNGVSGTTLTLGDVGGESDRTKKIIFNPGGFANVGAFNTNSNGDKIVVYSNGVDYDARIGIGDNSNLWFKSIQNSGSTAKIQFYTGTNTTTPTLSLDGSNNATFSGSVTAVGITNTSNLSTQDSLITRAEKSVLADSLGIITLATGVAGWGEVMAGDNQEWASFRFTSAGVVTLIANSSNVTTTVNTVDKLNIYDAGSGIAIQNNLGARKTVAVKINYYTP